MCCSSNSSSTTAAAALDVGGFFTGGIGTVIAVVCGIGVATIGSATLENTTCGDAILGGVTVWRPDKTRAGTPKNGRALNSKFKNPKKPLLAAKTCLRIVWAVWDF